MKTRGEAIPGTGLTIVGYLALVVISVALFLFWDGVLWRASREASHVGRFVVSYAAVLPLAAAWLAVARRFSWGHLVTSTGAVWGAKLLVTAVLYQAFARGTATELVAVAPPARPAAARSADYRAAADFAAAELRGVVTRGGAPAAGAVIFLDAPPPGRPLPAGERVSIVIRGARYGAPVYVIRAGDEVEIVNEDSLLHTAHLRAPGEAATNLPVPPHAAPRRLEMPEPGLYDLRCDNHAGERAAVIVVDHPYVARAGEDGSFSLDRVPAGLLHLVAVHEAGGALRRAERSLTVSPGAAAALRIDLDAAEGAAF